MTVQKRKRKINANDINSI